MLLALKYNTLILSLLSVNTSLEAGEGKKSSHDLVKQYISEWWNKISDQKAHECKNSHISLPKLKILNQMPRGIIRSYTCENGTSPSRYIFKRWKSEDIGYPDGKGKLKMVLNSKWKSWTRSLQTELETLNICYEFMNYKGMKVGEVLGTFRNGLLNGMAKIKWEDNSTSISRFYNGRLHGFHRTWDSKENLVHAGVYHKGFAMGFHWHVENRHLVYSDTSVINHEDRSITVLFSLLSNGSLGDPFAGELLPHINSLENAQHVLLTGLISNKTECVMKIEYNRKEGETFRYTIEYNEKISISIHDDSPFCDRNADKVFTNNASHGLRRFFNHVDNLIYRTSENNQERYGGYQVLWYLKPYLKGPDKKRSIKLISNVTYNYETKQSTAVVLGSKPLRIQFHSIIVDKHQRLNGYCDISIHKEDRAFVPQDKTLKWPPYRVKGMFTHGELHGIAVVYTDTLSYGWVTVKRNVLHGPCVFHGILPNPPV